jgi:hypothetical protein
MMANKYDSVHIAHRRAYHYSFARNGCKQNLGKIASPPAEIDTNVRLPKWGRHPPLVWQPQVRRTRSTSLRGCEEFQILLYVLLFWVLEGWREGAIREAMDMQEPLSPPSSNEKEPTLFVLPPSAPAEPAPPGRPRLRRAQRQQVVMYLASLDSLLPEDHRARWVWEFVQGLDLGPLYAPIRAVEGRAGRDALDPRILLALWLYATLDGVGSARALARLCEEHLAYRWLCGGVSVNYHTCRSGTASSPDV